MYPSVYWIGIGVWIICTIWYAWGSVNAAKDVQKDYESSI